MVETGETIVLGGLIDDDVQESEKKVPVLGNIPVLGKLFKSTSTSRTKRNLIVFLRPTIVRDTNEIRSISNRKYNYFEALQNLSLFNAMPCFACHNILSSYSNLFLRSKIFLIIEIS